MVYLSGHLHRDLPPGVGVMVTYMMGQAPLPDRPWAADTGCFAKPERYRDASYLSWLLRLQQHSSLCLFATAPDVWGSGKDTLKLSKPVLPLIRALGFPAAIVLQPGITVKTVPWGEIDAVFIGGVDEWQRSDEVAAISRQAIELGKHLHRGRVNSKTRLIESRDMGCHSADGTFLKYGPDTNLPKLKRWLSAMESRQLQIV